MRLDAVPKGSVPSEFRPPILTSLYFIDGNHGWAVGEGGTLARTTAGGQSWIVSEIRANAYLFSVCFTDQLNGWAGGEMGRPTHGVILQTWDGGVHWKLAKEVDEYRNSAITGISCVDSNHAWAAWCCDTRF